MVIKIDLFVNVNSAADIRMKVRIDQGAKTRLLLGAAFAIPFSWYMIYNIFAPTGVTNNFRSSNGAYFYWV